MILGNKKVLLACVLNFSGLACPLSNSVSAHSFIVKIMVVQKHLTQGASQEDALSMVVASSFSRNGRKDQGVIC